MRKTSNILARVHSRFINLPTQLRKNICQECGWSTPTFYRKMRIKDKPDPNDINNIIPSLSNAEKDAILRQAQVCLTNINDYMRRLSKK
ncbi:hypothetical protein [Chitinophaga sp. CB10]|uniref:hypothetical protein n=1 Tax=Chitinophaga sp. CB10 TaxID=1891659 RepID=UPI0025C4CA5C|nr:hypothetical protein [Chitinophaga sp. CB10]